MFAPTPYPDVNAVLERLLNEARTILAEQYIGFYLYGSLASGDFVRARSDIDFVFVTDRLIEGEKLAQLEVMHAGISASDLYFAKKLEGSYLSRQALLRYVASDGPYPHINEGRFYMAGHGADWVVQRYVLREQGVIVDGPAIRPLIEFVSAEMMQSAIRSVMLNWWQPMVNDPAWVADRLYQSYATVTVCRVLYLFANSEIVSKTVAADWAITTLDPKWTGLIRRAFAWPDEPQPDELADTVAFIRYTLEIVI